MKIHQLNEAIALGLTGFETPERVLDPEILSQLQDATMITDDEDVAAMMDLGKNWVNPGLPPLAAYCSGFDMGLQYAELVRRAGDLRELECSVGIGEGD